jgi:two-component system response regulator
MLNQCADILLVEDDLDDVKLALLAFKGANLGNTIHVARDGVEALEFLFCSASGVDQISPAGPKLILLDLKLPGPDGHEVLRRIKSDPRTSGIPVIVLTSSSEEQDVMRAYGSGAHSYIVKPFDFEQFMESVRDIGTFWLVIS